VPALGHSDNDEAVERALARIDGVLRVSADHDKRWVAVDYLLTKTDYQSLERVLETAGFPPAMGRWARFRSGWFQNLDLTGRGNADAPPPACCSKPPTRGHRSEGV
jgi:copper chaperone CopZ